MRTLLGLLALALLVPLAAVAGAAPAAAETLGCQPSPETGCLLGTLRAGETLAEVEISVAGPGGEQTATSGPDGRWSIEVTEEGEYTATIVEDTLPEGVTVEGPVTVNASLGQNNTVLFRLTGESDGSAVGGRSALIIQSAVSGLRLGLLLALAAVGLSLIYGTTGLSSFSHAEQVTLGGIVAFIMVNWWGLPFLAAAVLTVLFCGFTGYFQHAILWKPLRRKGLGLVQLMIVTIGLSLAMQYMFQVLVGAGTVRIIREAPTPISWGPVRLTDQSLWAMGIAIVVLTVVGFALLRTRLGRATRAVSDNPALAEASGIDVDKVVRLVWISATALAGLAGIMLALVLNGVKWDSGMQILLLLFAAVTLGGLGTAFGALAGAIIIGLVVELTPAFGLPGDLKYATALLILILLLMVRPQGLLGKAGRIG
ncbi:branched-chain amino acid ABC transporter permease [Nostocoides sp. F2B08]|uniref:branched-chain amino acid ABC transporter permease n=1 Tax=Nostocoides sp. F2B08 TaxID=2653936 RepID=UPI0012638377|nr:branched-chain amino acid ABC transporter permease [Tetrasphaera sp. F2B08]KAB7744551.1 branched-chain amino acid ABC transporter permease [Tetrasphaera sp. F2B08]